MGNQDVEKEQLLKGYGLITDYIAAVLHALRNDDRTALLNDYAKFDGSLSERDHLAIRKTFSGMMKLVYPDGKITDEELIDFSAEWRKRVKDQLYVIDSTFCTESAKFEYTWLKTGETIKVETLENIEHRSIHTMVDNGGQNMDKNDGQENKHETKMAGSRPRIKPLVAKTISIRENQGGVTYKDLFGDYLRTAKEICITDPYIRQPYQIDNLVDFIQMVKDVSTRQDTIKIHLSTQNDDDEKVAEVIDSFNDLADELLPMGIEFTYDFKADHDRFIKTDTGWTIALGRGLDIYEKFNRYSLCRSNQKNRRCKAFNVSHIKTEDYTPKKY